MADALTQNIYSKTETNRMFEDALKKIDQRFLDIDKRFEQVDRRFEQMERRFEQIDRRFEQVDQRFDQLRTETKLAISEVETRFERALRQNTYIIIGSLGSLITIMSLLVGFAHHFFP